ncbi:MAG: UDP-N-acetylmuramate dehydrogenase [bacterium]|nr:UDP-N-acetylmuramate dehydrogenase [bacterium]
MFESQVSLVKYSNYKIGGLARHFCAANSVGQLTLAVEKARKNKSPIFILGGGTNLLINDNGFDGLVLKPEIGLLKANGDLVTVGAGVPIDELLDYSITRGLSGLEWAGGLPGTLGGAVRGNAGAFGGEIKDVVKEVVSLDISKPKPQVVRRDNKACRFGYRDSVFKQRDGDEIILEATLALSRGDKKAISTAIEEKIAYRQNRQPLEYPNIGSIFKNVDLKKFDKKQQKELVGVLKVDPFPVVPTAYLIHVAGLKGVSWGGAMISPKHPNFIVNVLDAKAEDVKKLIELVKLEVNRKFKVDLEEEVITV